MSALYAISRAPEPAPQRLFYHCDMHNHPIQPFFTNAELFSLSLKILKRYCLDPFGIHGINHWTRVLENGAQIAAQTGANMRVVQLFALFHDSRRMNDDRDPDHGARGAALAGEMNGSLFMLAPGELALLQDACIRHTKGFTEADITVQTCWDADRLDLPRAGKIPVPECLCTAPGRDISFMNKTRERAVANHLTCFCLELRKLLV